MRYMKYGFKHRSDFDAYLKSLRVLQGLRFAQQVHDLIMVPKIPYIRETPKNNDHQRVQWARSVGMTKAQARKYMRHGVIPV